MRTAKTTVCAGATGFGLVIEADEGREDTFLRFRVESIDGRPVDSLRDVPAGGDWFITIRESGWFMVDGSIDLDAIARSCCLVRDYRDGGVIEESDPKRYIEGEVYDLEADVDGYFSMQVFVGPRTESPFERGEGFSRRRDGFAHKPSPF